MALEGFTETTFEHGGAARVVYRRGSGPAVVIMHEIPGITPEVARFARIVADAGFSVFMPHLFGTDGKPMSQTYALGSLARACVSREFAILSANRSSPIADWLRALCRAAHAEVGGKGVGAIGMCFTGNFALALVQDAPVVAPVLSQPSLPAPIGKQRRAGLHVSPEELVTLKRKVKDEGLCVLGMRFTGDPAVPKERFDHLRRELGDGFEAIEIDSSPGNPYGIPRDAHSVVTTHLVDREGHPTKAALDRVLGFFRERLH